MLKYVQDRLAPDEEEKIFGLLEEEVRACILRALPVSWYPLFYLTDFHQAIYTVMAPTNPNVLEEAGYYSARYASRGFYKVYFKVMKVERILERASRMWDSLVSNGTCTIVHNGPKDIDYTLTAFGGSLPDTFAQTLNGWSRGITEAGGGKNVRTRIKVNSEEKFAVNTRWE